MKKTGARVPLNWGLLQDGWQWLIFFTTIQGRRLKPKPKPFTVAFAPDRARPWYLIWPVLQEAGGVLVDDPAGADLIVHFDDSTFSPTAPPVGKAGARLINFSCQDVSKSRVAAAFEETFGYPLRVDPRLYQGEAVEKSEQNAAHDGRIVRCPTEPRAGRVYQRVIDNRIGRGLVEDLRTVTVDGRAACVFLKRRPVSERFANMNAEVALRRPDEVFSPAELALIGRFAERLGLEWGGLDILRDKSDGRIYIVDANKTDMGPPVALSLKEKVRATRLLAKSLRDFISRPTE